MKKFWIYSLSLLIASSLLSAPVSTCTTFCLKNKSEMLFGRNYDYNFGDGMIMVNKRGVVKVSTSEAPETPAKWASKYGSVTFNQYGRENPMGGMNEAGLVIELMWLDEARYPKSDSRPAVDVLEWIQYHLDTAATTKEVVANSEAIRIKSDIPLHYLVNDVKGDTATIEFLDGKLTVHSGRDLPVSALANDTYENSMNYAREVKEFGGRKPMPQTAGSLDRFTRAAERSKEFEKLSKVEQDAVDYAFETLASVAQEGATQWSIVYDQKRGKIYFRTARSPEIKIINTKSFDYSCGSSVKVLDVDWEKSGDVTANFTNYTRKANRDLIERSFSKTSFLKNIPLAVKDSMAAYPESFGCRANVSAIKY